MIDIRLYIDGQRADLDNDSLIVLSYTLDDTENPTIVKNSFSKSITLPSTRANDSIFATMRSIRSRITPSQGFSPLVRTPFQLFSNGELIESGYVQLNDVTTKKGIATYKITLFGGLGDFFYNLMYDEDGNKRTLADLDYGIEDATDSESEMDFTINKDVVNASWGVVGSGRNTLGEAITFVPAYNGIGNDFDAEHAIINNIRLGVTLPTSYTNNDKTYTSLNGYGLATLPKALNEWEVRDLRSYMQRPALSVRMLIQAMGNPANNGGYTVELDPDFFNEENTLYHDAYITLPMLNGERENATDGIDLTLDDIQLSEDLTIATPTTSLYTLPSEVSNAQVRVSVPITLRLQSSQSEVPILYDSIYQPTPTGAAPYNVNSWVVVQAEARDDADNIVGSSNIYSFATSDRYFSVGQVDAYTPLNSEAVGYTRVQGKYTLVNGEYIFLDAQGNNTFPIEFNFLKGNTTTIRVVLRVQRVFSRTWANVFGTQPKNELYFPRQRYQSFVEAYIDGYECRGVNEVMTDASIVLNTEGLPAVATGSQITKRTLLSTSSTPADYLLSYAKLFGLRFIRDKYDKKVTITRDKFFTGRIHDISDRIDRDGDIKVTPNVFSKRIMRLALKTPDTYYTQKYKDVHGIDYAQKRVDTGYGFNADVEEIYKSSVFSGAVPCRTVSPLFYRFFSPDGELVPPIFAHNIEYALANGSTSGELNKYSQTIQATQTIDMTLSQALFAIKGCDATPKMCYFTMKDDKQEMVDIANNLVVFCGRVTPKDVQGAPIMYWLTDDVPEMLQLNGKVCYLVTQVPMDGAGNTIAIARTTLPQFLSIRLVGNKVYDSFEFAVSKENYLGEAISYAEEQTIYSRFWEGYYEDRMDVNTRIVECMVNLDGMKVDGEALRDFYYFDDAYWLLNKIVDYNPQSMALTKCQFVKVKTLNTYATSSEEGDAEEAIIDNNNTIE